MKPTVISAALICVASLGMTFGCAHKKIEATRPDQVADVDTATKFDIAPPSDANRAQASDLGASSSGRSR